MTPVAKTLRQTYEFGQFRLALEDRRLSRGNESMLLPPKEFELLLLLIQNPGQVMSRESLIKALWPNTVVEEANLNVHISSLRKALADSSGEHRYIETIPRIGYRFIALVQEVIEPEIVPALHLDFQSPPVEGRDNPGQVQSSDTIPGGAEKPDWFSNHRLAAVTLPLWLLAVAFLGILALIYFKYTSAKSDENTGEASINVVPLTTYAGREREPAFSPDGNQIAFVWDGEKGDNTDVYLRLVDGGNWVRLTTHQGDDVNPVWSPDGRTIAFYRSASDGDGIYLMPSLGGAERKLTDVWANRFGFGAHSWIDWSPDGKWLVVGDKSVADKPFSLFLVSLETGEKRELTSPAGSIIGDCSPAFSPDSRQIAFVRLNSAVLGEIYVVSVDGGQPKQLTFDEAGASNLTWMPNGREIIYSSRSSGKSRLLRLSLDALEGRSPQWLAACGSEAFDPVFSPKGNRLAWRQNADNTDIFKVRLKSGSQSAPAANPLTSLIASTAKDISPRYSPDGKRIVFVSTRSGSEEIWVSGAESENPIRLTSFRGPLAGSPSWSPDGRQIAFDSRPDGNADIFVVGSNGGQVRRVTTDPAEDIVPSWSRDGRWIYFSSNRSGRLQVWKTPVDGGEAVQVTKQGGFEPMESPDGQLLYFTQDRGSSYIWSVPTAGGEEKPVFDFHQKNYTRLWAIDRAGVYFPALELPAAPAIKYFSFSNGAIRTIVEINGNLPISVSGLSISPDGKTLLVPVVAQPGSDLMMIENFR